MDFSSLATDRFIQQVQQFVRDVSPRKTFDPVWVFMLWLTLQLHLYHKMQCGILVAERCQV